MLVYLLWINYNKPISQVFIEATSHIIASWQGRRVLLEAELLGQNHRVDGIPSWVPDWLLENRNHEHTGPIPARSIPVVNLWPFPDSWNREKFEKCCCLPESGIFAFRSPVLMTVQATSDVIISPIAHVNGQSSIRAFVKQIFSEQCEN